MPTIKGGFKIKNNKIVMGPNPLLKEVKKKPKKKKAKKRKQKKKKTRKKKKSSKISQR